MVEFLDFIKSYLETKFGADTDIVTSKRPKVYDAYQVGHEPSKIKTCEIQVQVLDNSEFQPATSFEQENANYTPLQITAYATQMSIKSKMVSASKASLILGEKIKKYIYDLIYARNGDANYNKNILSGRLMSSSPALPMNDGGSLYMTAVRFDFKISYPYVTEG